MREATMYTRCWRHQEAARLTPCPVCDAPPTMPCIAESLSDYEARDPAGQTPRLLLHGVHDERAPFPAACATCQRVKLEADIATRAVDALLAAGFALQVDDLPTTFGSLRPPNPTTDRATILAEMMATDDDTLRAIHKDDRTWAGWVWFVYGNGVYVLSDYSTSLEAVLEPVNAYVATLA